MGHYLDKIECPADIKNLTGKELTVVSNEIREFMLNSLSKTGGHLASNLGVIELTLALHYVFDFLEDRLVWDVGHQCYTHKIITGRKNQFGLLRQAGGISGFPDPSESDYDRFQVGHAGTAIPTAIGLALGEQIKKTPEHTPLRHVVALVGDASIVNGVSFEGLNNLSLVKRQMLIVLNDNSMAIDATVGAMAKYFSKVRLSHTYEDLRKTTKTILEHVPKIGRTMEGAMERVKKSLRMVLPASQMFEALNIPYFGPVDGHDVGSLIKLFTALKEVDHPVLLHVHTKKGKGFSPARSGPSKFHSTGPFNMNGDSVKQSSKDSRPSFTQTFGQHITELAQKDERIVAITSAMCCGTGLKQFCKQFPQRFFDVGIAESAAVDVAAGLAHSGLKPVVCIYSTFLQRGIDQIFQEVSLQNLPVVFCVDRAGMVGPDGPTHHGVMDIAYLRMIPNLILTAPATAMEIRLALEYALAQDQPVVIRYPKDTVPDSARMGSACDAPFVTGQSIEMGDICAAPVVIVSYGSVLPLALEAQQTLSDAGIPVGVVNARFAAPLDERIGTYLSQGKKIVTLEDHRCACGFGSAVLEAATELDLPQARLQDIRIVGIPRDHIKHNSRQHQLMQAGLNADKIVETVKSML
jgi:1-deoxy-D-xylulose-5-phosphate synthase